MTRIKTVGVAGAGTMGAGIAIVCARAGFRTRVFDLENRSWRSARRARPRLSSQSRSSAASWPRRSCRRFMEQLE